MGGEYSFHFVNDFQVLFLLHVSSRPAQEQQEGETSKYGAAFFDVKNKIITDSVISRENTQENNMIRASTSDITVRADRF